MSARSAMSPPTGAKMRRPGDTLLPMAMASPTQPAASGSGRDSPATADRQPMAPMVGRM